MTSMAAAACTQRGCSGMIEDGYCTVCGLAPAPELWLGELEREREP